ncbi:hypothetical protein GW796_07525 [archaeon]|nr:hypothetical protein [archaeon]
MKTIFLDFDGVLHGEGINGKGFFEHVPLFCSAIRPFLDNVNIVISSSWREEHSIEKLKVFFEKDIQKRIVGVTPIIKETYGIGGREEEILMCCKENNIDNKSWIALDDMERFFSKNYKNLLLIDSESGISYGDIKILEYFLNN